MTIGAQYSWAWDRMFKSVEAVDLSAADYIEFDLKTTVFDEFKKAADASGALNLRANGWHKVVRGLTTIDEILSITTSDE